MRTGGWTLLPYAPWLAWILPVVGSLLTPLFSRASVRSSNYVAVASVGLSVIFSLSMIPDVLIGTIVDVPLPGFPLDMRVLVDPLNVLMACVVSVVSLFVTLFSVGYMVGEPSLARFWFLIQLFIGGYMLIVLSGNLLMTFIGWEVVGLCCVYLTSFWYRDPPRVNAGLEVSMILRVGDLGLLASILLIYAYSGTFNLLALQQRTEWIGELSRSGLLLITTLLFLSGIVGKAAQFPLHVWLPDMLTASPSSFNALTECLAGPFLFARVLPIFHQAFIAGISELSLFFSAAAWVGAVTALLTALLAVTHRNIYRILAYSVSSVVGYMLVAFGAAGLTRDFGPGYLAGTVLLTVDAFIAGLLFLTAAFISYAVGSEDIHEMRGFLSGVAHRGMEVGVFAMISVPPLSGFWCTNWVQTVALDFAAEAGRGGQYLSVASGYGLFIFLIATGGFTALYGLRMMWTVFARGEHTSDGRGSRPIPDMVRIPFVAMLIVTMLIDFSVPFLIPLFNSLFLPIVQRRFLGNLFDVLWYIVPSISTVMTIIALGMGAYYARQIYVVHRIDPGRLMERHWFMKRSHQVLSNRLYLLTFFNKIACATILFSRKAYNFVEPGLEKFNGLIAELVMSVARRGYDEVEISGISRLQIMGFDQIFDALTDRTVSLSRWAYPRVELRFFERFNSLLAKGVTDLSERIREIHTGVLSYNMLAALVGITLLMVLLLYFGGV